MHEKTCRLFTSNDQSLMFPIIIFSTIAGAANFATSSFTQDPSMVKYIQVGIGCLSITTGILTTIANRLGYAGSAQAHHTASISWGKFNRLISIELSMHPNERMEVLPFMKMFRIELDRLVEQSPTIPESIIKVFVKEFKDDIDIKKPDITGEIEHTRVYTERDNLKNSDLKQLIIADLKDRIGKLPLVTQKNPVADISSA